MRRPTFGLRRRSQLLSQINVARYEEGRIAGFERRQQAEQERLHERERFDSWLKSVLRR